MTRTVQFGMAVAVLILALVAFHWVVFENTNTRPNEDIGTAMYCERQPDGSVLCWER